MDKLLTISELAAKLSLHPDTIRKWEALGHVTSLKTVGGHRRYMETEVERLKHKMKFPIEDGLFENSDAKEAWLRKDKFIYWKGFVEAHRHNPEVQDKQDEINKRRGSEMVLSALSGLSDEDWASIDKIDEALRPVYVWYRQNHEYFWETSFVGKIPMPMTPDRERTAHQLDGIHHILWGLNGIAPHGEKSVLQGGGSFPNEREQLALDIKNGWDGKTDRRRRPHYCPQCPPIMVGKRKDRQVGPALNLVDQNYSGTGTDIVRCEKCHKYFIITYKVDTIKALDRRS